MNSHTDNGTRYCPICGKKLVRNGHYTNGKIRLYCKCCKKSYSFNLKSRKTIKEKKGINNYSKYATGKRSIKECGWAKSTFGRHTRNIHMDDSKFFEPPPNINCIGIDGTGTGSACYLIANSRSIDSTKDVPLAITKTTYEKFDTGACFISKLPTSKFIVCDGQKGMLKAIKLLRPETEIQLCLFHVWQRIRSKLSLYPKTEAGKELLEISRFLLTKVKDTKDYSSAEIVEVGIEGLNDGYERYKDFINEKTYCKNGSGFRTHKNVGSAYRTLKRNLDSGMLFTFTKEPNIPRTNNGLEGGINSQIKSLMGLHRGSSYSTRNNMIMLYLNSRSKKYAVIKC